MSTYLQLKEEYAKRILDKARREFPGGYLAGLSYEIHREFDITISTDTLRRILIKRARGMPDNVEVLCKYVGVNWVEATISDSHQSLPSKTEFDLDTLVNKVCRKIKFSFERGVPTFTAGTGIDWLKNNFIELDLAEVEVLPSEYPVANRDYLLNGSKEKEDEFDRLGIRLLHGTKTTSNEILKSSKNIFVYGDPGSGKSTYLRWIALNCRDRHLLQAYVPLFLEVRYFSVEGSGQTLLTYFETMFLKWGISPNELATILSSGRGLFIFDGIDEMNRSECRRLLEMVRRLLVTYDACRFIFSSRLGFNFQLPNLQKVIISPFHSRKHIPKFVKHWFSQPGKDMSKADMMLEKFRSPGYRGIREIARRPVLLKLLCYLFEKFDEFPTKRVDVFQTGIKQLVQQSESAIDTHIRDLSELTPNDIRNILCRIASYFFVDLERQILFHTRDVERIIQAYCVEVYHVDRNTVGGEHILKRIEQFNGLLVRWAQNFCAFSHLTFQEYFVAQHLVDNNNYTDVYNYLTHTRWQFIIELVAELVPKGKTDDFFQGFKVAVDSLVNRDEKVKDFLEVLSRSSSVAVHPSDQPQPFTQVLVRAWYLVYAIGEGATKIDGNFPSLRSIDLPDMAYATSMISNEILDAHSILYNLYFFKNCDSSAQLEIQINRLIKHFQNTDSQKALTLKSWLNQIASEQARHDSNLEEWWKNKKIRSAWQLRISRFMKTLDIPCVIGLSAEQVSLLKQYYTATYLFSVCMSRSELRPDQHRKLANSMLLITHFPPDELTDFVDFPTL